MTIPQIKFGFFLAFKQSVWPFLAFCWNFHLATLSSNLQTCANTLTGLSGFKNVIFRHRDVIQKVLVKLSNFTFAEVHFTRQNLMLISPSN